MVKLLILTFVFISLPANAFILVSKNYRLKKPDDTVFKISSEGCPNNPDLKKAMKRAVEIWNDVPESKLRLKVGGTSSTSISSSTVPSGEVIIGCGTVAAGSAGETVPNEQLGSAKITLDNNNYNGGPGTYGSLLTTITHELGHAIGLNHSKDPASVMTYESNGWSADGPDYLSQDDVDGVTYLYPNDKALGGLVGSCSSFANDGKNPVNFIFDFFLGFLALGVISIGLRKLIRA